MALIALLYFLSLKTCLSDTKTINQSVTTTEYITSALSIPATRKNYSKEADTSVNTINATQIGTLDDGELPDWFKEAIKDVAYYLRAHKFNEFDRRYNRNGSGVDRTNYKYFPRPPLRALHWEVNRYCEPSFLHCVDYLRKKLKHVALRRQDDTSIVVQENKWGFEAREKMSFVDMECRRLRKVDENVAPPFEGPLERYQWRTTASYFMCWYTLNEIPALKYLGEHCDNFAHCLDMSLGPNNQDPRADDAKPYSCAQYSFCPDPCCANKHVDRLDSCWNSQENPCFQENPAGQRECFFNRTQNTDFGDIILNRWNVSCKCPTPGYSWSSMYGICVDADECLSPEEHGCISDGQACINTPGSFQCICRWGYKYSDVQKRCLKSEALAGIKLDSDQRRKNATENKWTAFIRTFVKIFGKSGSRKRLEDSSFLLYSLILADFFVSQ